MKLKKPVRAVTLEQLLAKYKKERGGMLVMDDYDGGRARQLDDMITYLDDVVSQPKYNKI
jgi:hypothetical protein